MSLSKFFIALGALCAGPASSEGITSATDPSKTSSFDIIQAQVQSDADLVTFSMTLSGTAGSEQPDATGALAGAQVYSYVWPTSLNPSTVGFEADTGILALAATSHVDFDDTPLYDENGDGDVANDGRDWHTHWVVLVPSEDCGPGALSVRDIPEGTAPALPATWPGLPLFIDSPSERPVLDGPTVTITMPVVNATGAKFDGVTSALQVNANMHAPLLCIVDVFDVASGDLSLPGLID